MSQAYNCVNCNSGFHNQEFYKQHYKSEHHRYNIKRKLIGLFPLTLEEYSNQFDNQISSKSSDQKQLHCQICSKSFLSVNTYKHHMNSQKHKKNRKKIIQKPRSLSKSSSQSQFQVLGLQKCKKCILCNEYDKKQHLKKQHNFPPFASQCIDVQQLCLYVQQKIKSGNCLFCQQSFDNQDSVKQHMFDVGHAKLDIDNFSEYQKFYLWKIEQTQSQQEPQLIEQELAQSDKQNIKTNKKKDEQYFQDLGHPTLQMLENKRHQRIKLTNTGAIINGKEVGYRYLRKYYKQYIGRNYPDLKVNTNQAYLQNGPSDWQLSKKQNNFSCANIHFGTGR